MISFVVSEMEQKMESGFVHDSSGDFRDYTKTLLAFLVAVLVSPFILLVFIGEYLPTDFKTLKTI